VQSHQLVGLHQLKAARGCERESARHEGDAQAVDLADSCDAEEKDVRRNLF